MIITEDEKKLIMRMIQAYYDRHNDPLNFNAHVFAILCMEDFIKLSKLNGTSSDDESAVAACELLIRKLKLEKEV